MPFLSETLENVQDRTTPQRDRPDHVSLNHRERRFAAKGTLAPGGERPRQLLMFVPSREKLNWPLSKPAKPLSLHVKLANIGFSTSGLTGVAIVPAWEPKGHNGSAPW